MQCYDVMLAGEKVGSVSVQQEGLYIRYSCNCILSGEVMYNLVLRSSQREFCLGVLVPKDGSFGLVKRMPLKEVGTDQAEFFLRPRHEKMNDRFVPIRAEEPFAYLRHLGDCVLASRNGQMGLILPKEK